MAGRLKKEDYADLIYNLAWLRKRYGLSKKEMAELMGIGVGSLNKLERGELPSRLRASALIAVADRFGITVEEQVHGRLGDDQAKL